MAENQPRCFVISPIGYEGTDVRKHADAVYRHIIQPAMKECHFTVIRADHLAEPGTISRQMFEHILGDELCVAVLTGRNPNVFYELGVAHAAKRPVIMLAQKGEDMPFDIKDFRCIYYDLEASALPSYREAIITQVKSFQRAGWKPDTSVDPGLV